MDHEMTLSDEQLEEAHFLNCELAEELRIVDLQMKRERGDQLTDAEAEELAKLDEEERLRLEEYPKRREELERRIAAEGGWQPLIAADGTNMDDWLKF